MRFPFVTRTRHEEVVTALARLIYPGGVPEEFQLLLGIRIAKVEASTPRPEQDEEQKPADEKLYRKIKSERESFVQRLRMLRRVRPSAIGPAIAAEIQRNAARSAKLAHPSHQVFVTAREQVK